MSPRFGFRTGSFRDWPVERTAAHLAQLGYQCLELCLEAPDVRPELLTEARCGELRRAFDAAGIGVASLSYHGDDELPADRLVNQQRAVHAAGWLGTQILVINSERTVARARQWPAHVAHFSALCESAARSGVFIAVEPEPRLVVDSSQDMLEMLQVVDSPQLKVNFDLGHAQVTDPDPAAAIRQFGSAIVHLHLEDIKDRVHKHLLFGEGDIDFVAVRDALVDINYAGPYVADLFGLTDPTDTATRALAGLKRLFA